MPLSKKKLRRVLGVLDPSLKGELAANQVKEDLSQNLGYLSKFILEKISSLRSELLTEFESKLGETSDTGAIDLLREELEGKITELQKEDLGTIQTQMQDIVSEKIDDEELARKLEAKIEKIRDEFHYRLSNRGGGNANRQINVNSSVMSNHYADINFQQFGNIGWTATNDHDLKRVNIQASILSGSSTPPAGATTEVQYNNAGSFGASSVFTYNRNTSVLSVPSIIVGVPTTYTATNVTLDRSYNANLTTVDEVADVLGTLIEDLRSKGLII